ncbi:uncharacterized protein A4U43_C01F90 [Asparagus officinalis]|uniref:NAD-dependent epimerase/dehydratase domain-containing protein n=1 Tax=Asparagus officinalis TaxID=4686 RepID=A0A5P1FKU2_ASPOF|nr:cinnamoyl-CoA reductase 1-like [Asparagus officinalis]ONK78838.1 uncharacterized protein A4U43_C01F90 [Asparagus officinalis]
MAVYISSDSGRGEVVCVTGAGGFIASWLVKLLLEKGYTVKGTVRNPDDPKNSHLRELQGAKERLILVKADLLDYDSLRSAVDGCDGVFHTASPVTDDPEKIEPAVAGTENAVRAAADANVRRVVYTSSIGTVYMDPKRAPDATVDESYWSDLDYCKSTKNWYCYAKTVAEQVAWRAAAELNVDSSSSTRSDGPSSATINASTAHVMKYLTGSARRTPTRPGLRYVRDAAAAHLRSTESPTAKGRYICAESMLHRGDVVRILAQLFPQYPLPTKCSDEVNPAKKGYEFTTQKIRDLGISFTPVKQCFYETVKSLQEKGHLD